MRIIFGRMSIITGNIVQLAGLCGAIFLLHKAHIAHSRIALLLALCGAWVLLYFCCHAISHWVVGRILGIRFVFYTVGGTANPSGWPRGLRWIFEHLPFFGVQTEKASMEAAASLAKAIMWCAGVTSSAIIPTLGILWAWHNGVPSANVAVWIALGWTGATLISNWTSTAGDFAKARRALANSSEPVMPKD